MGPHAVLILALLALGVRCDENAAAKHAAFNTVVQAINPSGVRVAVPDATGVSVVVINANINLPINDKDRGQLSQTITAARNGYWTLEDKTITLKPNDAVFFWIYMEIDNREQRGRGRRIIKELVEPSCKPSPTTVNGVPACKGQLIFEENFNTFNEKIWKHTIQFSGDPDSEFSTYDSKPENTFVKNGSLHIVATLMDDEEINKPMKLDGCTWHRSEPEYCERTPVGWDILPPVRSGWINTKDTFAFKYGRIEARARAAEGDWLYSRVFLEGNERTYGVYPFQSGQMSLMRVRGNKDLVEPDGEHTGARRTYPNIQIGTCNTVVFFTKDKALPGDLRFTDAMHIHSVTWTPELIQIEVDGEPVRTIYPPEGGFVAYSYFQTCDSPWNKGDIMAPFDREFYLNLGLEVGGRKIFTHNSTSHGHIKPWKDNEPKIKLKFWKAREIWGPTWKSSFETDYIKVWAL